MTDHVEIHVGDHVIDREDDDDVNATMLVVSKSLLTAEKVEVRGDDTVADWNPEYPADDPVVEVTFISRDDWTLDTDGYAYPRSRLKRVAAIHDVDRLNSDGESDEE